ncbi:MAG: hypothetical protein AB1705_17940 [Verrucomicrobiota bacterium]
MNRFHTLLDQAIAKSDTRGVSRAELKELLADPYREYKRSKRKEERARISRLR